MYKIGILFQDREFEHDIYELIRAFYPGSEICSFYEEEEAGCDLYFRIEKQGDSCVIRYEDHENKGVTSAEFIEGQSSDALISCVDADDSEAKERAHAIRKERKDIVKIALYKLLVKLTGKTLPWGNLTGIRPAKLAMGLIESGMKNTEAAQEMRERYMVSPQKTALAITIANREREILKDIDYENGYSLYVGIPFCPSICLYCSFSSYPLKQWKNRVNQYLEALCKEIKEVAAIMKAKGRKLDTVYIGGGTPTTLEPEQLKVLLDALMENFCCENLAEFTIEAGRPDSITREKLMMIRNIKKPPAHRQAAFLILNCSFISSRLKSKLSVLHLLWQLLLYSMLTGSPYMYSGAGCSVQLHSAYNPSQIQQNIPQHSVLHMLCYIL